MKRLLNSWRTWKLAALGATLWEAGGGTAQAQTSGGGGTIWALPYFAVIFCIIIGLVVVVLPSRRRERAKQDVFSKQNKPKK